MTFSIVARSADGESWGVAVASKFLAVGSAVPAAVAGVGAIATQADANVAYKGQALAHLDDGANASVALQRLLEDDAGRDARQVGIVDVEGGAATHTGHACLDWAGGVTGDGYAIQGNILAGEEVVLAMEAAWETTDDDAPLGRRLLAALTAGDDAGGDSRGRQSAALLVVREGAGYGGLDDIAVDLRVDDHADPVTELARLLDLNDLYLTASTDEEKIFLTEEQKREVDEKVKALGFADLHAWIGTENYEMRADPDGEWLDERILEILRNTSASMSVLAVDAGTTGVTALVVDERGSVVAKGYQEFPQHFPRPGWVEHAPEEIWQAALEAVRAVLTQVDRAELRAVGITNQRETILLWDRETLGSPRRAIVWQDRRTADICERLRADGHEERVTELTGLRLDPYFSGTKLMWLAEHEPQTWALVEEGRYAVGTVDSYLVARMTRGTWHVTDVSNASRTLLMDLSTGEWSDELCSLFGVPRDALPDLVPNWGEVATTDPAAFCGLSLPIAGLAGDQQSALFGQTCFDVGDAKCTYGTGSFILTNTGTTLERSDAGLLSTAAWRAPDGELTYALEGAIFVTGAAVQWLRDGLQIVGSAAETAAVAATVDDTDGVVFVPALTGLGAPHWDPHARGTIIGITRGTTRAHIVRATLEAIAFEVRDVLETMPGDGTDPRCAWTAGRRPTTCSASSRPTRSAGSSNGPGSWRPRAWARRSWPGSASASGTPPTTCATPGSSTAPSTRPTTAPRRRRPRALAKSRREGARLGRSEMRR